MAKRSETSTKVVHLYSGKDDTHLWTGQFRHLLEQWGDVTTVSKARLLQWFDSPERNKTALHVVPTLAETAVTGIPSFYVTTKAPRRDNPGNEYENLKRARDWAARQFSNRWDGEEHPSFVARRILEEASEMFEIGDFGVEGFTDSFGNDGVQYLNMGDTYDTTLLVQTTPRSARFSVGAWGDVVERNPRWQNPSYANRSDNPGRIPAVGISTLLN